MKNVLLILFGLICCELFSQNEIEVPQAGKLELMPFSTKDADEFAPAFYNDGIVFTSNRKNDLIICYADMADKHLLDIYIANAKDSISFSIAKIFAKEINTVLHDGPVSFSADCKTAYITRNLTMPKKKFSNNLKDNKLGLFISELTDTGWTAPVPFEYNDPSVDTRHAALSNDGKRLFFVSNKAGGHGNADIYVCELENGKWSKPENIGKKVNTDGSEMFPFYHPGGRLYFASNRHNSQGGLDIFYTVEKNGKWQKPKPLGDPFNTKFDDFAYITDELFSAAYFSSNRDGNDNIYRYRSVVPEFGFCDTLQENSYCYTFFEDGPMKLDTTTLVYEWDLGDGTKIRLLEADHCFDAPGFYTVQLNVVDTATGEIYSNQAVYDLQIEDIKQPYISSPDTCLVGRAISFDGLKSYLPGEEIEAYYWDFGEGNRLIGEKVSFTFDEIGSYNVQLGLITGDLEGNKHQKCVSKRIMVVKK